MKARGVETRPTKGKPAGLGERKLAPKDVTRYIYRVVGPCGNKDLIVHNNSVNNLERGLVERVFMVERDGVLVPTPQPRLGAISESLDVIHKELSAELPTTAPLTREAFVKSYAGRKGTMYLNALESLKVTPLARKDSRTSSFVKAEKVLDKAPRIIQPRTARFHVELGAFIKPIEHRIYEALGSVNGETVVAKGLNLAARGELIAQKFHSFKEPVALGLDASRFDQHVSVDALRYCHRVYLSCYRDSKEKNWFRKLLEMTIDNSGIGFAKDGSIAYSIKGCRMSGDMDTALGNVLLMCSMLMALRNKCGLTKESLKFINDGDDCVLFMERRHLDRVLACVKTFFKPLGFTMKVEEPVSMVERVEFCQTRPVLVAGRYRCVRIPQTAMTKDLTCILDISKKENFSRWTRAVGECGASITGGVPVYQEFYHSMMATPKMYRGTRNSMLELMCNDYKSFLYRGMSTKYEVVSEETRASFFLAFGIEPRAQVLLENDIRGWVPQYQIPSEIDRLSLLPDTALISTAV